MVASLMIIYINIYINIYVYLKYKHITNFYSLCFLFLKIEICCLLAFKFIARFSNT